MGHCPADRSRWLSSVNVGPPREITRRGKTVQTSVWKDTVQGRRLVRRLKIDGDAQGDLAQGCVPRDAGTPTTLAYRASASAVLRLPGS